jgi:processive 1,2-diacylglycerol beta-glucosyltransferase
VGIQIEKGFLLMKILLLTAATGGGHLRASNAVERYIRDNTGHDVKSVDTLKAVGRFLDKTVCDSYLFMAKKVPALFGRLYKQTNKQNLFSDLVPKLSGMFSNLLLPAIEAYHPDVIITTHPFATEMVSDLKEDGSVTAPLICILTDYGVHRAWIADYVDAYVVASDDMVPELMTFGVPKEKIYPFGIPVHDVFFDREDRSMILRDLNFDPELPTLLFMAGSFGVSNIIKLYRDLTETNVKMQIIVITGRNRKLYEAFEKELASGARLPTRLIYFTDEVEKYMHASDLLVTKPGGLTVSEALACNLPLAVFDAIPGQEEDNANFLKTHDMGVRLHKGDDFAEQISSLLMEKQKLQAMRENCEEFDKSQSIPNLLVLIRTLTKNAGTV